MYPMTSEQLRNTFQSPFDINRWYNLLHDIFKASELKVTPEKINDDPDEEGYYLGNVATADYYRIGFFIFNIRRGSVANRRVGLRRLVRNFTNPRWGEFDAALVIFNETPSSLPNPDSSPWRLSFISDIKGKATAPKRYTYVFGYPDLLYKTPIERFAILQKKGITFENLMTAFSVEALSDEFFDKYREQYADFIQYITGKRFVKSGSKWEEKKLGEPNDKLMQAFNHDEKKIRDYIKKMMGRITFLHFLQRKGWMCGDLNYMQNMFQNSAYKNDYLDSVLEPLFFGVLNTKPDEREALFTEYGWDKNLLHEWRDIPYLNGGLFERDDTDEPESRFPAEYFQRLFQFFSEYNFTIDENDPNDAEVGVDPEMLGKIFENLLEDNKDKGAFYTPKEIVRYMCQESLIAYLETNTTIAKDKIRQFVLTPEEGVAHIPDNKKDKLLNALKNVKICDPAIGSGAFPMGLLNELLKCREALSTFNFQFSTFNLTRSQLKKSIIQNNIYGVDIEKGAVDIARLRFWLSIVVDEEEASPLPNLDYKIMQGNSLIESYKGMDLSRLTYDNKDKSHITEYSIFDDDTNQLQRRVTQLLTQYYSCSDHEQKHRLQRDISHAISQQLELQKFDPAILHELKHINLAENTHFFLWHTWFSDVFAKGGFDIVIGNPPYVVTTKGEYPQYQWNNDLYKMFYELGCKCLTNTNGHLCFITPKFWMLNLDDEQMRKYFSNKMFVKLIALCNPFETAVTENSIILMSHDNNMQKEITLFKYDNNTCKFEEILPISLEYCSTNLHYEWTIGLDKSLIAILSKLSNNTKLKEISYSKRGAEISKKVMRNAIDGMPSLIGQDMKRYSIQWDETYIDVEHKEYSRLKSFFENELIYLRRVDVCLEATISDKIYGFNKNVYGIKIDEKKGYETKFILGLLNSKLLDFYYKKKFSTKKEDVFPEIQTYLYEQLPIASASKSQQKEITDIVDEILRIKRNDCNADTAQLEKEIDKLVYELYGMTEEEIRVVEGDKKIVSV
ncbi:MAG: DNA modification methylase [Lentimicrobiaceae bacterium]|nr:DNA modification methylase [Lentimicrobiaceae bacterium]